MWTLRTKQTGSKILLKDYQKYIIQKLLIQRLLNDNKPISSGVMHNHLIETMNGRHPSRASVIFFLNDLVDANIATFKDVTGKGGHHKIYYTELSKEAMIHQIEKDINTKLDIALSEIFL